MRTATSRNTPKSPSTCADWLTNMHEYIEHQQNNVGDRPGYAAEERGQLPTDITHETELIQLAAQREKHREPEESDQGTALEIDVLERQNVGCEEHTEASEGHRRKAQAQGVRHHPPVTMTAKFTATIHSSRVSRPMLLSSLRAIAGASGVSVTPGGNSRNYHWQQKNGCQRRTDAASNHLPKEIFTPDCAASDTPMGLAEVAVSHRADETLRLAMPQNMR